MKKLIFNQQLNMKQRTCALLFFLSLFLASNALANEFEAGVYEAKKGHYKKALPFINTAVNEGNPMAQVFLGLMYKNGKGVEQNPGEAFRLFELAAKQEDADGQFNLGSLYDNGIGVVQDRKEAVKWYELSASQGFIDAQLRLGLMYQYGQGVTQSYTESEKWYRLAAKQGDADAQLMLGLAIWSGQGIKPDIIKAYMWTHLAATNGSQEAYLYKEKMNKTLTPKEIQQALGLSRTCKATTYKDC
jgi:uncharacterized protein